MHLLFLAPGFEEIEALCPLDLMRRAGLNVSTVAIGAGTEVTGAHKITVKADKSEADLRRILNIAKPESIILPGGMPGTKNLGDSALIKELLSDIKSGKLPDVLLAAICAAPSVPGKMGLYKGRKATCFPGFEKDLKGAEVVKDKVVVDGHFITAAGMGVALDFGLAIVEKLCGTRVMQELKQGIQSK